jgi:hypothetical protein
MSIYNPAVIYTVGAYRSGSTILNNVLGQLDGVIAVGELRAIWRDYQKNDAMCGCEKSLHECSFWQSIIKIAGIDGQNAEYFKKLYHTQARYLGWTHSWLRLPLYSKRIFKYFTANRVKLYAESMERIYRAIATSQSLNATVVDSSKEINDALVIALRGNLNIVCLHLIRDPRGNIYSILRKEGFVNKGFKLLARTVYLSLNWLEVNKVAAKMCARFGENYKVVRYEDFVSNPQGTLIEAFSGVIHVEKLKPLKKSSFYVGKIHSVAGNEKRFQSGEIKLKEDRDWEKELPPAALKIIRFMCGYYAKKFGYDLKS